MLFTYKPTIDRIIQKYEGGYGWNKADPGGPTKYGITCYDLAEFRGQKMDSMARWAPIVAAMKLDEAEAIYAKKYATGVRYNDLPAGVDACVLDYGINSGVSRAVLVARRIVGSKATGPMDQGTLDLIKKMDPKRFIEAMLSERLSFMHAIRGGAAWAEFGGGWGARVADLRVYSEHLIIETAPALAPAAPDLTKVVQPKAIEVAKTAGKPTVAGAATAGATAVAAGVPHWVVGAVIVGVFLVGVAYEAWQDYKTNKTNSTVHLPAGAAA